MVGERGRVKVLDFGLAKLAASDTSKLLGSQLPTEMRTRDGVVMGTMPYMSPEQVSGRAVDHRTDIFSLGIILYEMASGRRPFQGNSSAELISSILRDTPPVVTELRADLPRDLGRLIRRCLEKDTRDRLQSARDLYNELKALRGEFASAATAPATSRAMAPADSGATRAEEGFWVAVLPFKYSGNVAELAALAEGLTEDIVTGLSRFSYLRVIARSSTSRFANESVDVRTAGKELGARYVMEGSLRQAGPALRISVQLVDAGSGAHLWAETYNRSFHSDAIFELQDDLVPRIVSTVADWYGILPHSMSEALRSKPIGELSPYEALLRAFGYYERVTPEEHAAARPILEWAVGEAPGDAAAWAMLSMLYGEEHRFGFNVLPDPLGRSLQAARRAAQAAPSSHVSHLALAQAHYFRKELEAFRNAAERAIALNPMDGATMEYLGHLLAFAGDWERGCDLAERARQLNLHHPPWYWALPLLDAYRRGDYLGARAFVSKALMPGQHFSYALFAAVYGQLGEREAAGNALTELLALKSDFAGIARDQFAKWYPPELVEQLIDGLRKAGLDVPTAEGARAEAGAPARPEAGDDASSRPSKTARQAAVAIAVLPFSDMSPARDQEYLCEGMAEEIMNALVRIDGIRVASRTSAFRARQKGGDLHAIAHALSVGHVLEGSVRTSGTRLRVTAQLTDVASGYQLWSERYDREAADLFAVQDEIAAGVVEAVRARLTPGPRAIQPRPQVKNLDAYRHYLQGRHFRYTKNDHASALHAYEQAVALDPAHASSWVGVAEVSVLAAFYGLIPTAAAYARAQDALATAARLQGESAEARYVEGFMAFAQRNWEAWERAQRRAIELDPSHVQVRGIYGICLSARHRLDEALVSFQRARELDPLAPFPYAITGLGLLAGQRVEESIRYFDDALSFEKENSLALWGSGMANVALGRYENGIALLEQAVTRTRRTGYVLGILGWAMATASRIEEGSAILAELRARPEPAPTVASEAWLLAALGDADGAFEVLGRAEDERQPFLPFTGLPGFDPLRTDARFAAFLERMEHSTGSPS
jgi:TolB-like protein/Tfp pilus assembly protein PilF